MTIWTVWDEVRNWTTEDERRLLDRINHRNRRPVIVQAIVLVGLAAAVFAIAGVIVWGLLQIAAAVAP